MIRNFTLDFCMDDAYGLMMQKTMLLPVEKFSSGGVFD